MSWQHDKVEPAVGAAGWSSSSRSLGHGGSGLLLWVRPVSQSCPPPPLGSCSSELRKER